jgi:hypothetical protein
MSFVGCLSDHRVYEESLQRQIAAMTPEKKAKYRKRLKESEEFAGAVWGVFILIAFICVAAVTIWACCI